MKKLKLRPSQIAALTLLFAAVAIGLGSFTFVFANGFSYFSDAPEACANCHVMRQVFDDWNAGTHHRVAVCNDCHVPKDFIGKWLTKAENGFHHSVAFTAGNVPLRIISRDASRAIAHENCLRCHGSVLQDGMAGHSDTNCTHCHRNAGHRHGI